MSSERLGEKFFNKDALIVAPELIGKLIVRKFNDGTVQKFRIIETEAYRGEEDKACHASKGRTPRTEIMYQSAGKVYVYLIYGMYWLLNFVTSDEGFPAAVLIRGVDETVGPGRVGRLLKLDKSFYGESLINSERIWIEDDGAQLQYTLDKRVGIEYAGDVWANKQWRFIAKVK